jgi:hypothetical protein
MTNRLCWQLASKIRRERTVPSWSCCSQAVWHMPLLCVQWKTPDDGQRNCPKRVEFYSKNKFEKLMHLVGFIIRIYHDARSPERQIYIYKHYLLLQFLIMVMVFVFLNFSYLINRTEKTWIHVHSAVQNTVANIKSLSIAEFTVLPAFCHFHPT